MTLAFQSPSLASGLRFCLFPIPILPSSLWANISRPSLRYGLQNSCLSLERSGKRLILAHSDEGAMGTKQSRFRARSASVERLILAHSDEGTMGIGNRQNLSPEASEDDWKASFFVALRAFASL